MSTKPRMARADTVDIVVKNAAGEICISGITHSMSVTGGGGWLAPSSPVYTFPASSTTTTTVYPEPEWYDSCVECGEHWKASEEPPCTDDAHEHMRSASTPDGGIITGISVAPEDRWGAIWRAPKRKPVRKRFR
jgi:hypothetical protein